jgi:hypothetical protein
MAAEYTIVFHVPLPSKEPGYHAGFFGWLAPGSNHDCPSLSWTKIVVR